MLDSGASRHMTDDKREFVEYEEISTPIYITVANGHQLKARGTGTVRFILENGLTIKLTEVSLHCRVPTCMGQWSVESQLV